MSASNRRRRLSNDGITRIVRAAEAFPPNEVLTWKDMQRLASEHAGSGYIWTRQALERHPRLKDVYLTHEEKRRALVKKGSRSGRRLSEPEKMARLERVAEELTARLHQYDELFVTYVGNAISHGMTVEELSRPLERPTRGRGNSDET